MTSKEERKKEFLERCVKSEGKTVRIDGSADRKREAKSFQGLSEYHGKAVSDNLNGEAPLMAIVEGYYVMLHKANQALALAGFKSKSHECTLIGLRGIFNVPDLADDLRRAYQERRNVDYYINPDNPQLEEFKSPSRFVENMMKPFVRKVDDIIKNF